MNYFKRLYQKVEAVITKRNSDAFCRWLQSKGIRLGKNVRFYAPYKTTIDLTRPSLIQIGNNVRITSGVALLTHGADWHVLREVYNEVISSSGKLIIEDNVFIGLNSIVLKGVTIGRNSIIGAGSVVTKSVPSNSVVAGNPSRLIMSIEDYYLKRKKEYLQEAVEYARSIRECYGRKPEPKDFWEEFPLFLRPDVLRDDIPIKYQLDSSYDYYKKNNSPMFEDFEAFLKYAGAL